MCKLTDEQAKNLAIYSALTGVDLEKMVRDFAENIAKVILSWMNSDNYKLTVKNYGYLKQNNTAE